MLFVTYMADTGELVGVTAEPPTPDPATCTRVLSADSVELSTWDSTYRAFREELSGEVSWKLTRLAFRNRFTLMEKAAMEFAALDNPAAQPQERQKSAMLRAYMADLSASTFIDLQRQDARTGVLQLEYLGLLAAGRATTILDTPPSPHEVYTGS